MKSFFSGLFFTIATLTSFSQIKSDSSRHLSFKGVPIDGTLSDFVTKMQKSGFIQKVINNSTATLVGEFASYKDCVVEVSTMKQKDLVTNITVIFPDCSNWSSLSSNYFNLKDLLTEKYNKPSEATENFQSYTPDSDGSKFTQVKLGDCKYYSTFVTEKGSIQLSIENERARRCFVKLVYFDKINSETLKKQALEDL